MQLSKKQKLKVFSELFDAFLKSTSNFEHFFKKDDPHSWCIYELIDCKRSGYLNF